MSDRPPAMPPQSEPFPGSRTPGWNDPPTLQYNPLNASGTSGKTRLNLNKRVAFPLQGTPAAAGASPKPTAVVQPNQNSCFAMPPPPVAAVPPMALQGGSAASSAHPVAIVHPTMQSGAIPYESQQHILQVLRNQVGQVQEDVPNKREEIERRLDIITQLWLTGVLSNDVQNKLHQLSKAIEEQNFVAAMESYTSLVTNNSNECASWAVALRHLVLTIQPSHMGTLEHLSANSQAPVLSVPATPRSTTEQIETNSDPMSYHVQQI